MTLRYLKSFLHKIKLYLLLVIVFLVILWCLHYKKVVDVEDLKALRARFDSPEAIIQKLNTVQYDTSMKYKYHPFIYTGTRWTNTTTKKVGIATQCSLDHALWLPELKTWKGMISVSVFVPDLDFTLAVKYIQYLRKCHIFVREQVSFHFVFPKKYPPVIIPQRLDDIDCSWTPSRALQYLLSLRTPTFNIWKKVSKYPQNLMRNIARLNLPTEYVICSDIDMLITDENLNLDEFVSRPEQENCSLCAYVIPVYEVKSSLQHPTNKKQLLDLVKKNLARGFHKKFFSKNQGLTDLARWEKNVDETRKDIAYMVQKYEFYYEPIYLARNVDCPLFQERFVGYGMTRNTQVYEMYLRNWKFYVMKNVFLIHYGFTNSKPLWRFKQCTYNARSVFPALAREWVVKYDKDPLQLLKTLRTETGKKFKIAVSK